MDLPLVKPLQPKSLPVISQPVSPKPLLKPVPLSSSKTAEEPLESVKKPLQSIGILRPPNPIVNVKITRILDFDTESVAAGFDDPEWVPHKLICVAWSWVGEDTVDSRICGPLGLFGDPSLRRDMLAALLEEIHKAEMVTGHYVEKHDLPFINAECMRLGLEPIRRVLVQDTSRLVRARGFKKGQDNISDLLKVSAKKKALNWQGWEDAYNEADWLTIRDRCESDVIQNKQMRAALINCGYLRPPRLWRG